MHNIKAFTTKTGPDDAGPNILLTEVHLEECRARVEATATRLDNLVYHVIPHQLDHVEAIELLRVIAETIQSEAQEIR